MIRTPNKSHESKVHRQGRLWARSYHDCSSFLSLFLLSQPFSNPELWDTYQQKLRQLAFAFTFIERKRKWFPTTFSKLEKHCQSAPIISSWVSLGKITLHIYSQTNKQTNLVHSLSRGQFLQPHACLFREGKAWILES